MSGDQSKLSLGAARGVVDPTPDQDDHVTSSKRAAHLIAQGRLRDGLTVLCEMAASAPTDLALQRQVVRLALSLGDGDRARAVARGIVTYDPLSADGWLMLAEAASLEGYWREVQEAAERALSAASALGPTGSRERAEADYWRGIALLELGDAISSVRALLRSAEDSEIRERGRDNLAVACVEADDPLAALAALSEGGTPGSLTVLGRLLLSHGRSTRALEILREPAQNGSHAEASTLYADGLLCEGRSTEARTILGRAIAISPDDIGLMSVMISACEAGLSEVQSSDTDNRKIGDEPGMMSAISRTSLERFVALADAGHGASLSFGHAS